MNEEWTIKFHNSMYRLYHIHKFKIKDVFHYSYCSAIGYVGSPKYCYVCSEAAPHNLNKQLTFINQVMKI